MTPKWRETLLRTIGGKLHEKYCCGNCPLHCYVYRELNQDPPKTCEEAKNEKDHRD